MKAYFKRILPMYKRVAIYSRVSTQDQKTLEMQIKACEEYATARGWKVIHKISEIGSGTKKREKREDLLKLCRQRNIDVLIVWKLDRWGRSVPDIVSTLQELQILGVQFVSITEALDFTTPIGRAMSGLLAVFAEFERDMLSERVKAGVNEARLKGKRLGRPPTAKDQKEEIESLWKEHGNKSLIARKLGLSRRSIGRVLS
jgi:putative DNA-invertase from lambdoid prophage Rac